MINDVEAQSDNTQVKRHRIGIVYGFGGQSGMGLDESYHYEVRLFQFEYHRDLTNGKSLDLDMILQPQYNLTQYFLNENSAIELNGYEYGLTLGLQLGKWFFRDVIGIHLLICVGPHYVSGVPLRQSPGFIFSDGISLGVQIRIFQKTFLILRQGFRHISNAGFKYPNGGVNNIVLSMGTVVNL